MQSIFIRMDAHKAILCSNWNKTAFRKLAPNTNISFTAVLILFSIIQQIAALQMLNIEPVYQCFETAICVICAIGFQPAHKFIIHRIEVCATVLELVCPKDKKKHPWMLSYPMCNEDDFFSVEFNRFEPYFTIMDDAISYNSDHVRSEELVVENHMQALAQQICGYPSRYCRDSFKLMCGFSYMGTNNCPHYLNGECDGYVDAEPQLPELILDEDSNIKSGCSFELLLKSHNIDIKDIEVGIMRLVTYDEITNAAKKHFSA